MVSGIVIQKWRKQKTFATDFFSLTDQNLFDRSFFSVLLFNNHSELLVPLIMALQYMKLNVVSRHPFAILYQSQSALCDMCNAGCDRFKMADKWLIKNSYNCRFATQQSSVYMLSTGDCKEEVKKLPFVWPNNIQEEIILYRFSDRCREIHVATSQDPYHWVHVSFYNLSVCFISFSIF